MKDLQSKLNEFAVVLQGLLPEVENIRAARECLLKVRTLVHQYGIAELDPHLNNLEKFFWQEIAQMTAVNKKASRMSDLSHFFKIFSQRLQAILTSASTKRQTAGEQTSTTPIKKRVLIVEDSQITQLLMKKFISASPDLEVVGIVSESRQVLDAIRTTCPDVITLDIFLPGRDGFELLEDIIKEFPIPIVIVSSIPELNGIKIFHSLYRGAVDFIHKSSLANRELDPELFCKRLLNAATCSLPSLMRFYYQYQTRPSEIKCDVNKMIVIGVSVGGTRSLIDLLTQLPKETPPVLIVQKIAPSFSKQLIQLLHETCPFIVKEAEDGELVAPHRALLIPKGKQAFLSDEAHPRIKLLDEAESPIVAPVDSLFKSAGVFYTDKCIAVLLGGGDTDGANGVAEIRTSGGITLVEDEYTSYDSTLSREAVRLEGATVTSPSDQIPDLVLKAAAMESKLIEFSIDSIFSGSSPRILIVDDSPTIRAVMRHCLRSIGLTNFEEAKNGLEAWKALVDNFSKSQAFDLVISDQNMPEMKGTELLEKVRNHPTLKTLPFILATVEAEASQVLDAVKKGVTDYITKPVSVLSLSTKIKSALVKPME